MRSALETNDLAKGAVPANKLVALTTEFLDEFDLNRVPEHDRDTELVAALRVYRNAAFAFRKLADPTEDTDSTLVSACIALIEQGDLLLQSHLNRLA
jgi:hypothetical protein